jgi:hypothetical protein
VREVLNVLLPWCLSTVWLVAWLRWDEVRLPEEMRERCFPSATFWSAVLGFGPLALGVHIFRTRRGIGRVIGVPLAVGLGLLLHTATVLLVDQTLQSLLTETQ